MSSSPTTAESLRLADDASRAKNWKRWGPYLSARQWGTVREDYSADGDVWNYFPHDHARSRAYRWGEDGLLGICDRECRLCFSLALWNGKDPILKERLFGLAGPEGNHGEDVKEEYFYLDNMPTHSYMKALYKYPQSEFPYNRLVEENANRSRKDAEFELVDTGIFNDDRYFDVFIEYAKSSPDDLLIKITAHNRGPETAVLHLLPTLWFRNTWAWGTAPDGQEIKPRMSIAKPGVVAAQHQSLGRFLFSAEPVDGANASLLFTENETNVQRLYGAENYYPNVKDAFHDYLIKGRSDAINAANVGTKVAAYHGLEIPAGGSATLRLRLCPQDEAGENAFAADFEKTFRQRAREADEFFESEIPSTLSREQKSISRQAFAGLLWNKQFYHYVVRDWLMGDPAQPPPPKRRERGRNSDWQHLFNRDVISMPDNWEYPWYAAWDLAFHVISFARIDPDFSKEQLILFMREWYMHPSGQLPAYEFNLSDVNPPVHAWACWRVYKMTGERGHRDRAFLERAFQKLLINFTWWVNRKDVEGRNIFGGGFLGLDNIGLFDRSQPLPSGQRLDQSDGTAWMAFYCSTMLSIALELAAEDSVYEDVASKFFEHFVEIVDAMNALGGTGLWDEEDGFYYDQLWIDGKAMPLRVRSMVGLLPLIAVEVLEDEKIDKLPGFAKRMRWFIENRKDLSHHISYCEGSTRGKGHRLLAVPSLQRMQRALGYMMDENEFLSPFGLRSLSKIHGAKPSVLRVNGKKFEVRYMPGESETPLFGGNSNWRGPIWFPVNYLIIEALERYHYFYGDRLKIEFPAGSGKQSTLKEIAEELAGRMTKLFLRDEHGRRPSCGADSRFADHPQWRDYVLFHEFFHGESGKGLGASHHTGWTALVTRMLEKLAPTRRNQPIAVTTV